MGVSRAGFYKWRKRGKSSSEHRREELAATVRKVHEEHPSHGYRWVQAFIALNYGKTYSPSFVYKAFRYLGIQSETKHKPHYRPRKVKDKYPNLIFSTWETVDRPRQVIVSDMTAFHIWCYYIEITFYFDVFTKQILTYRRGERRGDRNQYIDGAKDVVDLLKGCSEPTILHTDQGSVYASMSYSELIKGTNIVRSMSRAGKPTDNPVNESLNGWIKEELYIDFKLKECKCKEEIERRIEEYVNYYNKQRPCYSLGYDTPDHYYQRYRKGELEKKDTFSKRELTTELKFVRKRKEVAEKKDKNNEHQTASHPEEATNPPQTEEPPVSGA